MTMEETPIKEDSTVRNARKLAAREKKRQRIQDGGGKRPRRPTTTTPTTTTTNKQKKKKKKRNNKKTKTSTSSTSKITYFKKNAGGATLTQPHTTTTTIHTPSSSSSNQHRFGRVMTTPPCLSQPRHYTFSIALPGSILSNLPSQELRTIVVGQLARAATIYHVDEVVIYDDFLSSPLVSGKETDRYQKGQWRNKTLDYHSTTTKKNKNKNDDDDSKDDDDKRKRAATTDPHIFLANLLHYCECPQYLRRHFFPFHRDFRCAGLLHPIDAPHHVRAEDVESRYREGVVLEELVTVDGTNGERDDDGDDGGGGETRSLVDCGLREGPVMIDVALTSGVRCTVKMEDGRVDGRRRRGTVVSPSQPREEDGTYWGYSTRIVPSLAKIFDDCPFSEKGYDLKIGTSERGTVTVDDDDDHDHDVSETNDKRRFSLPSFRHGIMVFGGVAGIEEAVDADDSLKLGGDDAKSLFDLWVNICPFQGSRTIRTEEAVLIGLSRLRPHIVKNKPPPCATTEDKNNNDDNDNISKQQQQQSEMLEFSDESPSEESSDEEEEEEEESD